MRFTTCFFVFLLFLTFSFQFRLSVLVKKFWKFFCSFILWIRDFVILWIRDFVKDFYQRIMENSSILTKKNRDIVNTKHFQNSIVYYLLFNFLVFLTSFFLFYLSMVFKKFLKFLCCFIVWIRDFNQKFYKTMVFFFSKKIEIFESHNFNKIPSFTISFLFF